MTDTTTETPTAEQRLAAFHARREESVVQPRGFLALTSTDWITGDPEQGQTLWNVPGTWYPLPAGQQGLRLVASASDGITVGGELVDGEAVLPPSDADGARELRFSDTVQGTIIHNDEGTEFAVRTWDAQADDLLRFGRIDSYPYDPEWVVQASFTPVAGLSVGFEHTREKGHERDEEIPGLIVFDKDGEHYELAAFKSGRALQLVFADATSGTETYSVGRFLFVAPNPDGTITLDFNYAVLPPCAFSYAFNCPMPPAQNRFAVPIRAGEKQVLAKDGSLLHG